MKIVQNGLKNYTAMYNLRDIMQAYYDSVDSNLLKPVCENIYCANILKCVDTVLLNLRPQANIGTR